MVQQREIGIGATACHIERFVEILRKSPQPALAVDVRHPYALLARFGRLLDADRASISSTRSGSEQ
jgi:hypothetical protein